jgi:hypothetical protein
MQKEAQAAMEFLMTYGWAILVVLVVIGALAYFGVLDARQLLPQSCFMQTGIACKGYMVSSGANYSQFVIVNGLGNDIKIVSVSLVSPGFAVCNMSFANPIFVYSGDMQNFSGMSCYPQIPASYRGQKKKFIISVGYYTAGLTAGLNHTIPGEMVVTVS